ncbi:hypothetical protein H5410_060579 [Solanum commersonii]|uniref:Uncharacterized protein n=1 Tax=Solanum commersonii TaxID=4109 RepID=A0A9J5W5G2_SOLCO|nr:hypothetical protein H5410_060579 [Solanum commersonii]
MSKDVNNNMPINWVKLLEDIKAYNSFSWGDESYQLIVNHSSFEATSNGQMRGFDSKDLEMIVHS